MAFVNKQEFGLTFGETDSLVIEIIELLKKHHVFEEGYPGRDLVEVEKVKISFRKKEDVAKVKLQLYFPEEFEYNPESERELLENPKLKYSKLKKMMKKSYAELCRAVQNDILPPADLVENFINQSAKMVTYGGRGDEHYGRYSDACFNFERAYDDGDQEKMKTALARVQKIKKECHEHYK